MRSAAVLVCSSGLATGETADGGSEFLPSPYARARNRLEPGTTDAAGRYCLNDLHRASGGDPKHQPAFWLRNSQTQALIAEVNRSANSQNETNQALTVYQGGNGPQGTYVVEELVIAYAAWISAAFHVKVLPGVSSPQF